MCKFVKIKNYKYISMKRMIMMTLVIFTAVGSLLAQPRKTMEKILFYGVDFTNTKICLATESEDEFREAFLKINSLLLEEQGKYDLGRALKADVAIDISAIWKLTEDADLSKMKITSTNYPEPDHAAIVKAYELAETEGTGIVFIAELLNKPAAEGTYTVVKFDIESREILESRKVSTMAGGFGLRNYWANTVYKTIKAMKTGF